MQDSEAKPVPGSPEVYRLQFTTIPSRPLTLDELREIHASNVRAMDRMWNHYYLHGFDAPPPEPEADTPHVVPGPVV